MGIYFLREKLKPTSYIQIILQEMNIKEKDLDIYPFPPETPFLKYDTIYKSYTIQSRVKKQILKKPNSTSYEKFLNPEALFFLTN